MSEIDDYIATFPEDVQEILQRVRAAILAQVPGAEERISYGMPAVLLEGRYVVHFGGWKKHVGVYPVPSVPEPLQSELAPYRAAKHSVNFTYAKPIPYELIARLTVFLVERARG